MADLDQYILLTLFGRSVVFGKDKPYQKMLRFLSAVVVSVLLTTIIFVGGYQ